MRHGQGSIMLLLALTTSLVGCFARTPAIRPDPGKAGTKAIASLEKVRLGGVDQWVLMRGRDTGNPVLLWLHGGPGSAQMPIRALTRELEECFVVVHWDQRGAGKSNRGPFDESTMHVQQFIEDAHELTTFLKQRFGQERIYILGHSWGTQLGLLVVRDHPGDYHAYIGVSQLVHRDRSQELAHAVLSARIGEAGNEKDAARLAELGEPPYQDHADYVRFVGMFDRYGGNMDASMARLAWTALTAPEYTVRDLLAWRRGAIRGSGPMWDEPRYQHFDAFEQVPRLGVPAYFFQGVRDLNTPVDLTVEYAEALEAPLKRVVLFEASAHTPFLGERDRFILELRRIRAEIEGARPYE
jgi:pimeloyl-ACP methyl ester carboxylesterase